MNKAGRKKSKPEGWREVKLGDIAVFHYGKSLTKQNRVDGDIPVFSSAGLVDFHDKALTDTSGIIIGRKGTAGKVYYSKTPFYCIDTAFYILPSDKYSLEFLFHLLLTLNLDELNEDSAVPGLNRDNAYQQEVFLPPLAEQEAIAEVLSSLDDKIDLLHRQNKTLEDMAQTLFRQWFIEEANEEWKETKLGEICTIMGGGTPKTKVPEYWDGDIPWLTPKDLSGFSGTYISDGERNISELGLKKSSAKLLPKDTVLLTTRAPVGYLAISKNEVSTNQGFRSLIPNEETNGLFLFHLLKQNVEYLKSQSSGSTFGELTGTTLKSLSFLFPPVELAKRFESAVNPLFNKIKSNQDSIYSLTNLRDTLLPKLVGGKVSVRL